MKNISAIFSHFKQQLNSVSTAPAMHVTALGWQQFEQL